MILKILDELYFKDNNISESYNFKQTVNQLAQSKNLVQDIISEHRSLIEQNAEKYQADVISIVLNPDGSFNTEGLESLPRGIKRYTNGKNTLRDKIIQIQEDIIYFAVQIALDDASKSGKQIDKKRSSKIFSILDDGFDAHNAMKFKSGWTSWEFDQFIDKYCYGLLRDYKNKNYDKYVELSSIVALDKKTILKNTPNIFAQIFEIGYLAVWDKIKQQQTQNKQADDLDRLMGKDVIKNSLASVNGNVDEVINWIKKHILKIQVKMPTKPAKDREEQIDNFEANEQQVRELKADNPNFNPIYTGNNIYPSWIAYLDKYSLDDIPECVLDWEIYKFTTEGKRLGKVFVTTEGKHEITGNPVVKDLIYGYGFEKYLA